MNEGITVLIVIAVLLSCAVGFVGSQRQRNHRSIMCKNGTVINGQCICADLYTGTHCDRPMHCKFNKIQPNGSCVDCLDGWKGSGCDQIECVHGVPDEYEQNCSCEKPYSGKLCNLLETANVRAYGPLGALTIIPLLLILFGCERTAHSRRIRRVEEHLFEQNMIINRHEISTLLNTKIVK